MTLADEERYIYPEGPEAFPYGKPSGKCPSCGNAFDVHHYILDISLLGKSTEEGNKAHKCPKPVALPDQGVNNA